MLKILLAFLIFIDVLVFALIIYCLTGISVLLPGLGLIIAGGFIAAILFLVEIFLVWLTILVYRRTRGALS